MADLVEDSMSQQNGAARWLHWSSSLCSLERRHETPTHAVGERPFVAMLLGLVGPMSQDLLPIECQYILVAPESDVQNVVASLLRLSELIDAYRFVGARGIDPHGSAQTIANFSLHRAILRRSQVQRFPIKE